MLIVLVVAVLVVQLVALLRSNKCPAQPTMVAQPCPMLGSHSKVLYRLEDPVVTMGSAHHSCAPAPGLVTVLEWLVSAISGPFQARLVYPNQGEEGDPNPYLWFYFSGFIREMSVSEDFPEWQTNPQPFEEWYLGQLEGSINRNYCAFSLMPMKWQSGRPPVTTGISPILNFALCISTKRDEFEAVTGLVRSIFACLSHTYTEVVFPMETYYYWQNWSHTQGYWDRAH